MKIGVLGAWRMRNGGIAEVTEIDKYDPSVERVVTVRGIIGEKKDCWYSDGSYFYGREEEYDLIAPFYQTPPNDDESADVVVAEHAPLLCVAHREKIVAHNQYGEGMCAGCVLAAQRVSEFHKGQRALRFDIAVKAMESLIMGGHSTPSFIAAKSFEIADAMLEQEGKAYGS